MSSFYQTTVDAYPSKLDFVVAPLFLTEVWFFCFLVIIDLNNMAETDRAKVLAVPLWKRALFLVIPAAFMGVGGAIVTLWGRL